MFDNSEVEEMFIVSVDGMDCQIWEPRHMPSLAWYFEKFNKAGLAYELGIVIYHNQLVWINGPFPAGQNDKKIFNKLNGLKSKIPAGLEVQEMSQSLS
jgi:hypothetical protein